MNIDTVKFLRCPSCRSSELDIHCISRDGDNILEGSIICGKCQSSFAIKDSIPILVKKELDYEIGPFKDLASDHLSVLQKFKQRDFHDAFGNTDPAIDRPHGYGRFYKYLTYFQLEQAEKLLLLDVKRRRMIDLCGGSGVEAEYFARKGAIITVVDISFKSLRGALERSHRYGFKIEAVYADAENLPFIDSAFDIGFTHEGLHHLPTPTIGLCEMGRICSDLIFIVEPAKSFVKRIAVALGISSYVEESGNFVHSFKPRELIGIFQELGFQNARVKRYFHYYPKKPPKIYNFFENVWVFSGFKKLYEIFNFFVGVIGNRLVAGAWGKEN